MRMGRGKREWNWNTQLMNNQYPMSKGESLIHLLLRLDIHQLDIGYFFDCDRQQEGSISNFFIVSCLKP